MNWLESILYGLISGFCEFLPVSASAHQILLAQLFGAGENLHLQNFLIHLATLLVLLYCYRQTFSGSIPIVSGRSRNTRGRSAEARLLRTAAFPLILAFLLYGKALSVVDNRLFLVLFFLLNGFILFLPSRLLTGNKDARAMSGWDGLIMGIAGALGILPGISRIGAFLSAASARGADKVSAVNWAIMLSVPAIIALLALDAFGMVSAGTGVEGIIGVFNSILSMAAAGVGTYFGIMLIRFLAVKAGFSGFAYYSWGAALFTFILYLVVV